MTRKQTSTIANALVKIFDEIMRTESIDFEKYNFKFLPEPITSDEYDIMPLETIQEYLYLVTKYMLSYSLKYEVYEVCTRLEKYKTKLKEYEN